MSVSPAVVVQRVVRRVNRGELLPVDARQLANELAEQFGSAAVNVIYQAASNVENRTRT